MSCFVPFPRMSPLSDAPAGPARLAALRVAALLAAVFVAGCGGAVEVDLNEVRALHESTLEVETELSYVRRMAQARIDIIGAELDRQTRRKPNVPKAD